MRGKLLCSKLMNPGLVAEGGALCGSFCPVNSDTLKKQLLHLLNQQSANPIPPEAQKKALKKLKLLASVLPVHAGGFIYVVFMLHVGQHDDDFFNMTHGASQTIGRSNSLLLRFTAPVMNNGRLNDKKLKSAFVQKKFEVLIHAPGTTKFYEPDKTTKCDTANPQEKLVNGVEKMNGENLTFYACDVGDDYIVVVCSKNAPFAFRIRKGAETEGFMSVGAFLAAKETLVTNEQGALVLCNRLADAPNTDAVLQVMLSQHTICELMNPHFVYCGELRTNLCVLFARQFNDGPGEERNGSPVDPAVYEGVFTDAGFTRPKFWTFANEQAFLFAPIEGIVPYEKGNPAAKCKTVHYDVLKWLVRELLYALTWKTSRNGATNSFTRWLVEAGLVTVDLVSDNLVKVFEIFQEKSKHHFDANIVDLVREHWNTYFAPRLQVILKEVGTGELTYKIIDDCSVGVIWWLADCKFKKVEPKLSFPEWFDPSVVESVESGPCIPPQSLMVCKGAQRGTTPKNGKKISSDTSTKTAIDGGGGGGGGIAN